tara:strand:- start:288 stop:404 length:117 start_codon:yes stop_codon:yes gene_type:complete
VSAKLGDEEANLVEKNSKKGESLEQTYLQRIEVLNVQM